MKKTFVSVFALAGIAALNMTAAVVRYDSAATGAGDGSSWADACTSMSAAIAAAGNDGEVWVKQGTHAIPNGGFALASGVTVMGGFDGGEYADEAAERAARDPKTHESILTVAAGDRIIAQSVACDNTAIADGITFTGATYAYINTVGGNTPLFRNCVFRGKSGICCRTKGSAGADFVGCEFTQMSGGNTYGIINFEGGAANTYTDCVFHDNKANGYGIVQNSGTSTTFTRCRFLRNVASYVSAQNAGGPCVYRGGNAVFVSCDFLWNASTNSGPVTTYARMIDCVVASNTVVNVGTEAASAYLLQGSGAGLIYNCSVFDNAVEVLRPNMQEGTARAVLFGNAGNGHGIVGSTVARNACRATVGSQFATAISATFDFNANHQGGFVNSTLVDNEVACDFIDTGRSSGSWHSLIANSIFRNRDPNYVPVKCLKPDFYSPDGATYVFDSFLQNYDNTLFKRLGDDSAVRADEPMIYNCVRVGRHVVYPVRTGTPEAGPCVTDAKLAANNICDVGTYNYWMNTAPNGAKVNINDLATGEPRPASAYAYGATDMAFAKSELLMLRTKVTPVGSGEIVGEAYQDVVPGASSAAITARTDRSGVVFGGWRKVGETEYLSTDPTFVAAAMDDDLALEAVFVTPKIRYTFDLGSAGTFVENGASVLVREYDLGDKPSFPEFIPNERFHIGNWDIALPDNVGDTDLTFTLQSIEMVHRIVRFDSAAADGGDGESWATAMNDMSNAVAKAGIWTGEVWVKEGVHTNRMTTGWTLLNNVRVMGGFAGVDGAYASTDAERAARDPAAHPATLVGNGGYVIRQTEHCDRTAIVDGLTLTGATYAYDQRRNETHPVFTNCTFTGKAGFRTRTTENGVVNSTVDFYDCRFVALDCSNSGGQYGPIDFYEGGQQNVFADCLFADNTVTKEYGLLSTGNAVCRRCRFVNNVGTVAGKGIFGNRGNRFEDCDFLWNRTAVGGYMVRAQRMNGCLIASNSVTRTTAGASASLILFNGEDSTVYGSSVFDNEVIADSSASAGSSATAMLVETVTYHNHIINSTVARNVIRAIPGEGGTAFGCAIRWSGVYQGGVVNCTFVDDEVTTAEVVDEHTSNTPAFLVNTILVSKMDGYVPVRSRTIQTGVPGICIFNCVIPGYDSSLVNPGKYPEANVSTDDPNISRMKVADDGRQRYFALRRDSPAIGAGIDITFGANGGAIIAGVDNYDFWYHDVTTPRILMPDILGNERLAGEFSIGACQQIIPGVLTIILR